jgi:hypothetical protein
MTTRRRVNPIPLEKERTTMRRTATIVALALTAALAVSAGPASATLTQLGRASSRRVLAVLA